MHFDDDGFGESHGGASFYGVDVALSGWIVNENGIVDQG